MLTVSLPVQGNVNDWPEDAPPIDNRSHLRVTLHVVRVDLGDGNLAVAITQPNRLQQQKRLELVAVEPRLTWRSESKA